MYITPRTLAMCRDAPTVHTQYDAVLDKNLLLDGTGRLAG